MKRKTTATISKVRVYDVDNINFNFMNNGIAADVQTTVLKCEMLKNNN